MSSDEFSIASLKALFRFPFQGPQWQSRFVIGSALMLVSTFIPIVPSIFVSGYVLRVMRQAVGGQAPTLPEWDDWGGLIRDGLCTFAIGLVYFLPALLIFVVGTVLYFASALYLPFTMGPGANEADFLASFMLLTFGSMAVMFLSMALGTLFAILGAVALPMATAHFVAEDRLGAAFRIRQWWPILKADKLGYFIAWVIVAGLGAVLYTASILLYSTMVLCVLLPFLVAPVGLYVALVGAALFGGAYRESAVTLADREVVATS